MTPTDDVVDHSVVVMLTRLMGKLEAEANMLREERAGLFQELQRATVENGTLKARLSREVLHQIIEETIKEWVVTQLRVVETADHDPETLKMIRDLYLAEPNLPASEATRRIFTQQANTLY